MSSPQPESTGENSSIVAINSSTTRSRLDDLPPELRTMLVNFTPLAIRVVLAHVPQLRIRPDDVMRARTRLCEWAAGEGYLDLLKWAHERGYPLLQVRDGKDACTAAARGGHLAVLQWLREIKCRWDESTCCAAAKGGHLELLQWAREHSCPWGERGIIMAAADGGHLHVLQWLRALGAKWLEQVTLAAAQHGHWEVFDWALANGCPVDDRTGATVVCCSGDLRRVQWAMQQKLGGWGLLHDYSRGLTMEVLCYLKEHHPNLTTDHPELKKVATRQLARVGDVAGLLWARKNGYYALDQVKRGATQGGQLALLKWAVRDYFSDEVNCDILAEYGHLEFLKWAVARDNRLTAGTCTIAARAGRLSVLQWLREMGCEWDSDTLAWALRSGHCEVIEWALKQGCPVNENVFLAAAQCGYANVLQWAFDSAGGGRIKLSKYWCMFVANVESLKVLREHHCPWNEKTCAEFAQRGELELLQWAVRNGCPWDERTTTVACRYTNISVLQWAIENGCPMDDATRAWWQQF